MRDTRSSDTAPAGQSGCRGTLFQHLIEHRIWTTWHRESFSEDHDRSSGCVHVNSFDAWIACDHRIALGAFVGRSTGSNPDAGADARGFTSSTGGFTSSESVASTLFDFDSGYNGRVL